VTRPLFVGVGNSYRSDDGVGPWLAQALAKAGRGAQVHGGDGTGLIDLFGQHSDLVILDATLSGRPAGTLTRIDAMDGPVPAELFHYSTHRFGVAEAIETARALGMLPERLVLYGIEGASFAAGCDLSDPVARAAQDLLETLMTRPAD